ncbi:MAG: hypothetical protein HOP16_13080 [Acidobacteria bacterium]|nr:hypothetical protein [Acidobacteriota bacterium]
MRARHPSARPGFIIAGLVLVVLVTLLVLPLQREGTTTTAKGFPPSQRLVDSFMALLCRPPNDAETLRWDTKVFTSGELSASVRATPESFRVRAIRKAFVDVLLRDPVEDGCSELREWTDRPTDVRDIARRLASSPEAQRVQEIRAVLRNSQGRDPAGWDNGTVQRWARSGFTADEVEARVRAQRPLVGVHYFAWYEEDSRGWGNRVTVVPKDTPQPSLGWYKSSDVGVMDAHIKQMTEAGFDFVILQVVVERPESWEIAHTFLNRLEGTRLKAVVMVDGLYTATITTSRASIEKASGEFASHPSYFWLQGSPLFLLYSGRLDFRVPGITLRNVYWADRYAPGENTFNPDGLLYPHDWAFWSPTPQPIVNGVVPITPGYSDTHLARSESMEYPRDEGRMYREQWQRALALRPEFVIVYSWNEHFERTAIEPTSAWGDQYLRWTACYAAHAHAGREGTC